MKNRLRARGRVRRGSSIPLIKNNIVLIGRERGKIAFRRETSNIWLDLGREYLAQLIAYQFLIPTPTPFFNDRIQYMGLGIGGTRQLALAIANSPPLSTAYPGSNLQTDIDPTVIALERPVRISGGSAPYPGTGGDVWLAQVQAPPSQATATQITFSCLFQDTDVSYTPFLTVPLSEIALFRGAANPAVYNNTAVAYDTFDTISKTNAFDLEVQWTVRF
jgi:hypothetical protein